MSLPTDLERALNRLRTDAPADLSQLRTELNTWRQSVNAASLRQDFLDVELAEKLVSCADALLEDLAAGAFDGEHRALVQAGLRYLVDDDDADPDLESPLGLEDDAAVLSHVAREVGRPDLAGGH